MRESLQSDKPKIDPAMSQWSFMVEQGRFQSIEPPQEGFMIAKDKKGFTFVDHNGSRKIITDLEGIQYEYVDRAWNFRNGRAMVEVRGRKFLINTSFTEIEADDELHEPKGNVVHVKKKRKKPGEKYHHPGPRRKY